MWLLALACTKKPEAPRRECGECHRAQFDAWARSHHARAQGVADGGFEGHPVRFVIGAEPVRQAVVELDGGLHVAPFNLLVGEAIPPTLEGPAGDWRGPRYAWAGSCAPCHATGFQVNAVKWRSLSVSCEACHVSTDGGHAFTPLARINTFEFVDGGAIARPREVHADTQTETCAQCHLRRRALVDDGAPVRVLLDAFEPELMTRGAFEPTGVMREEVFEAASFLMSKMQRAGVRCSHCHEPHSGELRAKGNALCAQCHRASVFDVEAHRGNSACVDCHMPEKTFLGSDRRRDHAFIMPGRAAPAFAAAFGREQGANELLLPVIRDAHESSFKRASALALLEAPLSRDAQQVIAENLASDDEWLRYGAASALPAVPPALRAKLGEAMLDDPRRAIRVRAARAIGRTTPEVLEAERANAFSGDAWLNLGALAADPKEAEALYRRGLEMDPAFVPLAINLADVSGDEGPLVAATHEDSPWTNDARYALGLAQWRRGEKRAALENFRATRDGGVDAHLVAWCLAEREVNGADAGWRVLDLCEASRPGSSALRALRAGWSTP